MKGGLIIRDLDQHSRAQVSPVCAPRTSANFLITGKVTVKQTTVLPENPMLDEKKRSVTWLHNKSFSDEHKSILLFLLPAEYQIFILLPILGI